MVTANSERYVAMHEDCINLFCLEENEWDSPHVLFLQKEAAAHTARVSMDVIFEIFAGRVISRNSDIRWPPRSPDLSLCDFFLWGYLKYKVYQSKPRTIPQLKQLYKVKLQRVRLQC